MDALNHGVNCTACSGATAGVVVVTSHWQQLSQCTEPANDAWSVGGTGGTYLHRMQLWIQVAETEANGAVHFPLSRHGTGGRRLKQHDAAAIKTYHTFDVGMYCMLQQSPHLSGHTAQRAPCCVRPAGCQVPTHV